MALSTRHPLVRLVRSHSRSLSRARGRASRLRTTGIDELGPSARLRSEDTLPAEVLGMMYLVQAQKTSVTDLDDSRCYRHT
jgi:hypothetical protein